MTLWRHYLVVSVFLAMTVGLIVRIVYLGVTERDFLQEQGDARSVRHEVIPAMRGVITDRHGEPLAISTPVYGVWADPSKAKFSAQEFHDLAEILGLSVDAIRSRMSKYARREFVYLKRRLSYQSASNLRAKNIRHVYLQPEYRRYYPAAETTAHVVGLTDLDDTGIEGIEYAYDAQLRGARGGKVVLKDLHGNTIRDLEYKAAPVYGRDLRLSLDLSLQFTAYRELKSAITAHQAKAGSIVIADIKTGEILSLVNQPSYNPNDVATELRGMRNRAVTDAYEPGSTIKPFTAIAALESGKYESRTPMDTSPGYFRIGRKLIQDPVNRGVITLSEAIKKSSQVAIAKIALELGDESVLDVLQRARVGNVPGTGLPGEAMGYLDGGQLKYPVVRAALAYGYGLSLTPLQLTQAYLTLATHGVYRPLTVLKTETAPTGERIFDESIAKEVVAMMETVTERGGTATAASVPGYRVAGKTGTARMVGPEGYDDERHAAWFAGVVPASDPRLVVVVLINEPAAGVTGGGAVAAPIFARIAQRSLPLLGISPDKLELAKVGTDGAAL